MIEYIFQLHIMIYFLVFDYIWDLIDPRFNAEYEPGLFDWFIWPFLFFLIFFIIFWLIWVLLKNKIKIKEIGNWKYLFLYIFPWLFGWIIWSPIVFWLLHKKIDKNFFIHSAISIAVYLIGSFTILIAFF